MDLYFWTEEESKSMLPALTRKDNNALEEMLAVKAVDVQRKRAKRRAGNAAVREVAQRPTGLLALTQ